MEFGLEIVKGQSAAVGGAFRSGIGTRLIIRLGGYAETYKLGAVYGATATYQVGSGVYAPDVSFISFSRLPNEGEPITQWNIVPDLAVEIISPSDLYSEITRQLKEYPSAGVKEVWIIEPDFKMVTSYRSLTDHTVFSENDELMSESLLPGFRLKLSELFQLPSFN